MKKLILLLSAAMCYMSSLAVPAHPGVVNVTQPDGSVLSVKLNGDEFANWESTADGYTIVKNDAGYYVYAELQQGNLVASQVIAKNQDSRSASDIAYLKASKKSLKPEMTKEANLQKARMKSMIEGTALKATTKKYDYTKFRGLVILVEFSDRSFSRVNAKEIFTNMVNQKNYTGFNDELTGFNTFTGSVRDYFFDNSYGMFDPDFDIIGPVKIGYHQTYISQTAGAQEITKAALEEAKKLISDFSVYDADGDKVMDMVYFVFAGHGSNVYGNDSRLVWPHASYVSKSMGNGIRSGRYACSTELCGSENTSIIDGIGTICHEFSHCLGLMDEYDTDYSGSGGESTHPGNWSVMSGGSYLNNSRTPCGYSLFQRYQSGFTVPEIISEPGEYSLESIDESNSGYRINSAVKKEYFMLENRRFDKWNKYLPGEGMLIFRVDSTNTSVWSSNRINANPDHNYYELLRAKPSMSTGGLIYDSAGDPFPGSGNITSLGNFTSPNLKSWTGAETALEIADIKENSEGIITFRTKTDTSKKDVEDFEKMATTSNLKGTYNNLAGSFCTWDIANGGIAAATSVTGNGNRSVALYRRGSLTSSLIKDNVSKISFTVFNTTATKTVYIVSYSTDNGTTWNSITDASGSDQISVVANSTSLIDLTVNLNQSARFRIYENTGNSMNPCHIDDVTFRYNDGSGVELNTNDSENAISAYREGDFIVVRGVADNAEVKAYTLGGATVASEYAIDGVVRLNVSGRGFYIISDGKNTLKAIL